MYCQPNCQRPITNDETALPSEVGFYYHFNYNETTGLPSGCPGWNDLNGKQRRKGTTPNCQKERCFRNYESYTPNDVINTYGCAKFVSRYAPEGEQLYKIVEEYADDQEAFVRDFIPAMEKMVSNGYTENELTPAVIAKLPRFHKTIVLIKDQHDCVNMTVIDK